VERALPGTGDVHGREQGLPDPPTHPKAAAPGASSLSEAGRRLRPSARSSSCPSGRTIRKRSRRTYRRLISRWDNRRWKGHALLPRRTGAPARGSPLPREAEPPVGGRD
jgi:hypothetical protein